MATNDLLPFATGSGANVMALATYSALAARMTGFQNGVADPTSANRAIRQAAFAAAMIGQFTAHKSGQNTIDNGDVDTFEDNFASAISQMIIGAGTINLAYGADTSDVANTFTVATTPVFTTLSDGLIVEFTPKNTNTITTPVIALNGGAAKGIVRNDGSALVAGEIVAGRKLLIAWDSTLNKFVLLGVSKKFVQDLIQTVDLTDYMQRSEDLVFVVPNFGGNSTAITGTASPAMPATIPNGCYVIGPINVTNTGAVTMQLNGGATKAVVRPDGTPLVAGDLISGDILLFRYNGSSWNALFDFSSGKAIASIATSVGLVVEEQYAAGVFVLSALASGAWTKRILNTVMRNTVGATVSDSQITLQPGKYELWGETVCWAQESQGNQMQARIRDVTHSANLGIGITAVSGNGNNTRVHIRSDVLCPYIVITEPTTIELQYYVFSTVGEPVYGGQSLVNDGETTVYARFRAKKLD